jgi:hypothetical protein
MFANRRPTRCTGGTFAGLPRNELEQYACWLQCFKLSPVGNGDGYGGCVPPADGVWNQIGCYYRTACDGAAFNWRRVGGWSRCEGYREAGV